MNLLATQAVDAVRSEQRAVPSIVGRFARMVELYGNRTAIGAGPWQPTYAELHASAKTLARGLVARTARQDRVAILCRHDAGLIVAMLAVLEAARVVVVLNATDPPARLEQVLDDADPTLIVTDGTHDELARRIARGARAVLHLPDDPRPATEVLTDTPGTEPAPDDLAFLVYTSGSTGRPKGVMQTHRNIVHNIHRLSSGMELTAEDRIVLLASPSGGQGLATSFCALLNGAALCPFPAAERGITGLPEWLNEHKISVYVSTATLFRNLIKTLDVAQRFDHVRLVRLGAEAALSDDFHGFRAHFRADCVLFHTLSTSETGNITQIRLRGRDTVAEGRLPAGSEPEGIAILLLDEAGRAVAPGAAGEIVVRSRYLSPGYWHHPALTAERFTAAGDARLFRSGDLARRMPDGTLLFLGRKDDQVKIHGYRVELPEIEKALRGRPGVEAAVVCTKTGPDGSPYLVAYIVPRHGAPCAASPLRDALRATLPGYMVPTAFLFLTRLPVTPHGKIDRERLRALAEPAVDSTAGPQPATDTESLLAGIWRQIFPQRTIGREDDFFDLGGDSLSAALVAARVYAARQVTLDLRCFADHPTLADLAGFIDGFRRDAGAGQLAPAAPDLPRAPRAGPVPQSTAQQRFWRYARTQRTAVNYNLCSSHRIRGPLDSGVLRDAMSFLLRRHAVLRTTFHEHNGVPTQIVHPASSSLAAADLPVIDLRQAADPEAKAARILEREGRRPFDLSRGPLLRFLLLHIRPDEHWLVRIHHHIISDAWSWTVYFRELAALYEAALRGAPPPLSDAPPYQYADYALWEQATLNPRNPAYAAALDWWARLLAHAPPDARLPFARRWKNRLARPADGMIWWGLAPATSASLEAIARRRGTTFYALRLAAFAALLAAQSGRPEVLIGTYLADRYREETQNLFGPMTNFIALPMRPDPAQPFTGWLSTVGALVNEAQPRSTIPHELLGRELRARGVMPPEAHAVFSITFHTAPLHFGGLEVTWIERRFAAMPWRFTLAVDRYNEADRCHVAFDARLHRPSGVRRFIADYTRLLDAIARDPDRPLADVLAPADAAT